MHRIKNIKEARYIINTMKNLKYIYLLAMLFISNAIFAQSPEGFNYQAVIRDASNQILSSQNVGIQFRLLQGSPSGTVTYTETHTATTDAYGLVALQIGTGTTSDVFGNINWGNGPYFLEIAADVSGGTTYSILGTQQLMSVPYALYAKSSGDSSPLEIDNDVLRGDANSVNHATTDFVFGSTQLDHDANADHYQRMFFDKSKAAFRVGEVTGDFWDEANRGVNSFANGFNTKANETAATAMGYQTTASGFASTAMGIRATASGRGSVVIGEKVNATSENAIAIGSNANANGYASIAIGASLRSESAYETAIGHYDTSYTPNSTTAWDTDDRLFTIGNGINNSNRSDAMVILKNGNTTINGDFNATGVISGDGSGLTNLPVGSSIFEKSGNLILPDANTVDIGNDDFVFGSTQLDRDSDADHQNRMFFDKSKGAFRVGTTIGTSWDASNVGNNSFATGNSTTASGNSSFAAGQATTASGAYSTAFGFSSIASGDHSTALGLTTISQSFAEITIGMYNTGYTPNSATGWDSEDRLFTIGNGQSFGNYSDALIVYKSGNTSINGDFNATGVISGDGSGLTNLPGGTADHIADADGDTKIQVEETANEDIIRFDAGGTQVGSVNSDGVWNMVASNHNLLIGNGNTGTGGSENTAIGSLALRSNIAGVHNTAIGYRAGHNSTGSGNLFIGANAGLNETGNNTLHIKNSSDFISGPLIYGEFDNDLVRVNGDFETTGDIDVTGVISGDGSGLTNLPISSGSYMQDTDGDTKIQVEETADEDIIRFDVAGLEVGNVNSDGVWDMVPDTSTGNLLIGGGNSGTGGRLNVFIGGNAGRIYNETLQDTYNTALGTNAMFSLETGVSNTAIGYGSLFNNTASSQNTTLGFETGYNNISGSGNVFIGYRAAKNETGSNKLYIENSSSTSPLIYGEFDTDLVRINGDLEVTGVSDVNTVLASNIGIGLPSAPSQKLSVAGNFKLGTNGSTLTNIIKVDVAKNIGNISSDDHLDVTFSVPGSLVGSSVMVSPSADLPNQVILGQARVSANGTVRVRFHNESNSGKDPANMTFYITVIK